MKTNDIKKGMEIRTVQLGVPVSGVMMDNKKGNIRMIETKGSEVGLYDEMGSVYSHDIIEVKVNEHWEKVEHTSNQMSVKEMNSVLFD